MKTITTKAGNSLKILKEEAFEDMAEIALKYGQGCNYETGRCVDGYQVDFDVEVTLKTGETEKFHIVFQSLDRSDNMRAYSSSEMATAGQYGCDSDEDKLDRFTDSDEEIIDILQKKAEKSCKEWLINTIESDIKEKLAVVWLVKDSDVDEILSRLDAKRWLGENGLESIVYAWNIDNEGINKSCGHNGYWIADNDKHICYVTNGNPVFAEWSEETANEIGVDWKNGDFEEVMSGYTI